MRTQHRHATCSEGVRYHEEDDAWRGRVYISITHFRTLGMRPQVLALKGASRGEDLGLDEAA